MNPGPDSAPATVVDPRPSPGRYAFVVDEHAHPSEAPSLRPVVRAAKTDPCPPSSGHHDRKVVIPVLPPPPTF